MFIFIKDFFSRNCFCSFCLFCTYCIIICKNSIFGILNSNCRDFFDLLHPWNVTDKTDKTTKRITIFIDFSHITHYQQLKYSHNHILSPTHYPSANLQKYSIQTNSNNPSNTFLRTLRVTHGLFLNFTKKFLLFLYFFVRLFYQFLKLFLNAKYSHIFLIIPKFQAKFVLSLRKRLKF